MEFSNKFVLLILVAVFVKQAIAATHNVGGSQGWDTSTDLDTWASGETFRVGDTLEFKYSAMHSVVELDKDAYSKCDVSTTLKSYSGGSTKITLDKVGTRYFACGTSGHCEQGMKVKISTAAANSSSSSSPSTPSAATSSSSPGATPSTSASSYQLHFLSFLALVASLVVSLI
ncbi:uclacyanin-3 [Phtheirospermum japonicum]|uniref:Uclacyanin-3 n=1 Tax=Phtheirospermum japonicum TaxID=374723 RepID=A0A830CI51_9LAMI|nr:uclacyanin-3 [Phtheirospermum japonicum]